MAAVALNDRLNELGIYLVTAVPTSEDLEPFSIEEKSLADEIPNELRRRDFIHGRRLARLALHSAGFQETAELSRLKSGPPAWPPGYVGSISHAPGLVGAVVGPSATYRSIGFDLERHSRSTSPKLSQRISAPTELTLGLTPLEIFSIKEACYKAIRPLSKRTFAFKEIGLQRIATNSLSFILPVDGEIFSGKILYDALREHFAAVAVME